MEDSELIQKVCEAAAAMDWATVITLAQQAIGESAAAMGVAAPPPAVVAPPMAASRASAQMPEAYARGLAEMHRATVESKRATVGMMIMTARTCFDAVDEKEHMLAADPTATAKHIASVNRKIDTAQIAASRAGAKEVDAKESKGAKGDETHDLDVVEIQAATRMGVTLAEYATSKARHAAAGKGN